MISYDVMVTEITARLGNRTDLDARIGRWINYALLEIVQNPRFDFREFDNIGGFVTQPATDSYILSGIVADFWFLLDVFDVTNFRKLSRTHWMVIDKIQPTSGQPVRYYPYRDWITLDPIPDANYVIKFRYRNKPTELTSGSTFDGLGSEWEEPIVVLATIKGAQALGMNDIAVANRQLIEPMLASRIDRPALEDMDSETTIEPGGDSLSLVPIN